MVPNVSSGLWCFAKNAEDARNVEAVQDAAMSSLEQVGRLETLTKET